MFHILFQAIPDILSIFVVRCKEERKLNEYTIKLQFDMSGGLEF